MIVFKTYLRVVKKSLIPIIIYTAILLLFSNLNIKNNDNITTFQAEKPDILIINNDSNEKITKSLINYLTSNSNILDIENDQDKIADALFYRDVNYIVYIPKNYNADFLAGKNPEIEIKNTGDYQASLANLLLERYLKVANIYLKDDLPVEELVNKIESSLSNKAEINMTSKLDSTSLMKATNYFNFSNYCLLGGAIFVICLILSSFKCESIKKRTIISSMNDKKINRYLLISNGLFIIILWLLYVIISFITAGDIMFSIHGLLYIINSFVFSFCSLTIAFLIGNLVNNKQSINGIVNVVALGSSFLCGSFVPVEFLPTGVLKLAHILPSYWYINTNNRIKNLEIINFSNLKILLLNTFIIIMFSCLFIIISNYLAKRSNKIG